MGVTRMSKGNCSPNGGGRIVITAPVPLPCGFASAVLSAGRLIAVAWEMSRTKLRDRLAREYPAAERISQKETAPGALLAAYSRGEVLPSAAVAAIPYAWERVAPFDREVLRATLSIRHGSTVAYGELAEAAGHPGAARAIGGALGRNPWPILVPCHRVIGRNGTLVGFGMGSAAKRALLEREKETGVVYHR